MRREAWREFLIGAGVALLVAAAIIALVSCPRLNARRDVGNDPIEMQGDE